LTWGGEAPPRPGDTVYIPSTTTLIVDQSSPVYLNTIIIEGNIVFADIDTPITLDA
jgi:hypothetical protein